MPTTEDNMRSVIRTRDSEVLVDTLIRLTHVIHSSSPEVAEGLRLQRSLIKEELLRRCHTGRKFP